MRCMNGSAQRRTGASSCQNRGLHRRERGGPGRAQCTHAPEGDQAERGAFAAALFLAGTTFFAGAPDTVF